METNNQETIQKQVRDLLNNAIQKFNFNGNDSVTMKTMKLYAVGEVLEELGLGWDSILKLFKTHTPVHPTIAKQLLKRADDELAVVLAQIFVRNEKLARLVKTLAQQGMNMEKILAVDGLVGNITNGPNFELKHYIGNLRFANKEEPKFNFDEESEFKRLHVQTVREMYRMIQNAPVPSKHVYEILRKCYYQTVGVKLPEIEFYEEEDLDGELEGKIAIMYMKTMGRERMESLVKSLRFREKRPAIEMEESDENKPDDKSNKNE